jgi:hypothetical protein
MGSDARLVGVTMMWAQTERIISLPRARARRPKPYRRVNNKTLWIAIYYYKYIIKTSARRVHRTTRIVPIPRANQRVCRSIYIFIYYLLYRLKHTFMCNNTFVYWMRSKFQNDLGASSSFSEQFIAMKLYINKTDWNYN